MAEEWRAFLPENCKREAKRLVVSERFCEDGEPVEWQVEALSAADLQAVFREGGGRSLGLSLLAAAVSKPNLRNSELQDSWGVMGAE